MTILTGRIHPDNRIGYQRTYWTMSAFTAVEVRAFNTTPGVVVHAPTDDWIVMPLAIGVTMVGGTAYAGIANNEDLTLRYHNGTGGLLTTIETTGFLDQVTDPITRWNHAFGTTLIIGTHVNAGQQLVLSNSGAITGGSPLRVRVLYQFVPAAI